MLLEGQVKILGREPGVSLKLEGEYGGTDINVGTINLPMVEFEFLHLVVIVRLGIPGGREIFVFLIPREYKVK